MSDRFDSHSDVDMICISSEISLEYAIIACNETILDCSFITALQLHNRIKQSRDLNNDFLLRGIAHGTILLDEKEEARLLQANAVAVWSRGPEQVSNRELDRIRVLSTKIVTFIDKCNARANSDRKWLVIRNLKSGEFLTQLVECHCRMQRVWSDSFWRMTGDDNLSLSQLLREIVCADESARMQLIQAFAEEIGKQAEFMRTKRHEA